MAQVGTVADPLPPRRDIGERIASLFTFDCIRLSRILETAQYALVFGILALGVGFGIDWLFRPLYPKASKKGCGGFVYNRLQALHVIGIMLLQVMISAISIIYIRKIGEVVPFLLEICPSKYVPHWKVKETEGEIAIALMFVGIQTSIVDNLSTLRKSFAYINCDENP